jgi:hypothetical protein
MPPPAPSASIGGMEGSMSVRDVMSDRPIVVGARESDVRRLMEVGHVHHVPVVDGGRLVGIWIATESGALAMIGPERVHETAPDADAVDALDALIGGAEAVLVWDGGSPVGVLTRADLASMVRTALERGIGRRRSAPTIVHLTGPAGAGTTTLLSRTMALLERVEVVVMDAADAAGALAGPAETQLILIDDGDGPHAAASGIGEDVHVAVVPAADLDGLTAESLGGIEALVATRADEASEMDTEHALRALRAACAGLHTFAVAAGHDDRGLDAWARWLEGLAFRGRR